MFIRCTWRCVHNEIVQLTPVHVLQKRLDHFCTTCSNDTKCCVKAIDILIHSLTFIYEYLFYMCKLHCHFFNTGGLSTRKAYGQFHFHFNYLQGLIGRYLRTWHNLCREFIPHYFEMSLFVRHQLCKLSNVHNVTSRHCLVYKRSQSCTLCIFTPQLYNDPGILARVTPSKLCPHVWFGIKHKRKINKKMDR